MSAVFLSESIGARLVAVVRSRLIMSFPCIDWLSEVDGGTGFGGGRGSFPRWWAPVPVVVAAGGRRCAR
jgi:hypothetical protein